MSRHTNRAADRRGNALVVTLVALVVLFIVIAAVVLGVIIPGVASAREAARRMQCTNNLKMIMLACHNHADFNGFLPPSRAGGRESNGGDFSNLKDGYAGQFVWLLPYMEQTALFTKIQDAGFPNPHTNVSGVYSVDVQWLACPSFGWQKSRWVNNARGTNYCASWGDSIYQTDESAFASRGVFRGGVKGVYNPDAGSRIVIVPRHFSEITDGTSNTIAFSEMVSGDFQGSNYFKGGIALIGKGGIARVGDDAKFVVPQNILDLADGDVFTGVACAFTRGQNWGDGSVSVTGFQTILPPNSPNARVKGESNEQAGQGYGICSASSNHSGGVNVAFADGSVRFVPDTIDCGDLTADVNGSKYETTKESHGNEFKGPSPFGVWGALGTINGGEKVDSYKL